MRNTKDGKIMFIEAIMKDFRKLALMLTFLENAIFQKRFLFLIQSSQISISLESLLLNEEMQNYISNKDTKRLNMMIIILRKIRT